MHRRGDTAASIPPFTPQRASSTPSTHKRKRVDIVELLNALKENGEKRPEQTEATEREERRYIILCLSSAPYINTFTF